MQQMSPLALVTHAAVANNQQAINNAAAAAAHHRLMGAPAFGQMPNLVKQEIESRMMEYLQLIQAKKEQGMPSVLGGAHPHQQQQQQHSSSNTSSSSNISSNSRTSSSNITCSSSDSDPKAPI